MECETYDLETYDRREALQAALARHGTRSSKTSTSDGFFFRGSFYAQPGAMKRLLDRDLEAFCSLAGTDFTEITPIRNGQPLEGVALKNSLDAYKATWRKAAESSS